jgi:hypothetical protein
MITLIKLLAGKLNNRLRCDVMINSCLTGARMVSFSTTTTTTTTDVADLLQDAGMEALLIARKSEGRSAFG